VRLIQQPNLWTCGPCAVAMVLDVTLDEVIEACGHDGSAKVDWDKIPGGRAGFNESDLTLAALRLGYGMVRLAAKPIYPNDTVIPGWPGVSELMDHIGGPMVLVVQSERFVGVAHSVAVPSPWASRFFDPAAPAPRPIEELPPVQFVEFFVPLTTKAKSRWETQRAASVA